MEATKMGTHSVRFIHTSDLHLDRTLGGLVEIPHWLRDDFIDAPQRAAENVFDAAIEEDVDFVLLAGDVLDIEMSGPRSIDFLVRQFERLAEKKISVYWAGSTSDDPELWPSELALPSTVHRFSTGPVQQVAHERRGRTIVTIAGQSLLQEHSLRANDFQIRNGEGAKIAVAHGSVPANSLQKQSMDYWALGGVHQAKTLFQESSAAHYCGSPQGLMPNETGKHGCTLVTIEHGRTQIRTVETDVIRWQAESIELPSDSNRRDLENAIRQHQSSLRSSGKLTLVTWNVVCHGPLGKDLRSDKLCDNIVSSVGSKKGDEIVTIGLQCSTRPVAENLYDEETILGDFLRAVREFEEDPQRIIDLAEYVPDSNVRHELISVVSIASQDDRRRIMSQVAALGVELLSGETEDAIAQ